MKKRLLSALLAVCMVMTMAPAAFAADKEENKLQSQIDSAQAGAIIQLDENYDKSIKISKEKDITLDLNGHKISSDSADTIYVEMGATLKIVDTSESASGKVDNTKHGHAAIFNNGTVTLEGGTYDRSAETGTTADSAGKNSWYTICNHGIMTVKDGVTVTTANEDPKKGRFSSLFENGYYSYNGKDERSSHVENTNHENPSLTIEGGTFSGGLNTIKNDDGATLVINDGTFTCNEQNAVFNVNVAEINGGTFETTGSESVLYNNKIDGQYDKGEMTVTGGTFTAKENVAVFKVANDNSKPVVTGGTFSNPESVKDYLDASCTMDESGTVVKLDATNSVAKIDNKYYRTLGDAVAAVTDSTATKIELLGNAEGNGIVVPSGRNITFDLGGFTYTISGNTVGSTGTETNGFQLLKDSNVTFKNGTLISEKAALLLQNYCNLTLDNMILSGGKDLVVSNNNGKTIIRNTKINASETGDAFDVYSFGSYTGGNVIVEGDSTINGDIQVGYQTGANTNDLNLSITSGTVNGKIKKSDVADETFLKNNISISGGTFTDTENAGEYLDEGCKLDGNTVVPADGSVVSIGSKGFKSLEAALNAVTAGDTIKLLDDVVESKTAITLPAGVTLDGNGKTLKYTAEKSDSNGKTEAGELKPNDGAFITVSANSTGVTIKNITINAGENIKHGVQFYCVNGGKMENVKVIGGGWTSVIVNGAQNIELKDCDLQPQGNQVYANIEYAMGQNVKTIPSMTLDNVSFDSSVHAVWADKNTVNSMITAAENDDITDKTVVDTVKNNVTSKNNGSFDIAVQTGDDKDDVETVTKPNSKPSSGGSSSGSSNRTLTFNVNGGSELKKLTKAKGTTIDLSDYTPTRTGYTFAGWYSDKELTEKVTSVKLSENTTVYAKWTKNADETVAGFTDVKAGDWFAEEVQYVVDKGLMSGTSKTTFAPSATTTRGMIVAILHRLEKEPAATASAFTDVKAGAYYEKAINWAAANEIVKGMSETIFAPDQAITREQMAAILYRYAQFKGYDMSKANKLDAYADAAQVSAYAVPAMQWANAENLITGKSATVLDPKGNATRAEVSSILMRFCENIAK